MRGTDGEHGGTRTPRHVRTRAGKRWSVSCARWPRFSPLHRCLPFSFLFCLCQVFRLCNCQGDIACPCASGSACWCVRAPERYAECAMRCVVLTWGCDLVPGARQGARPGQSATGLGLGISLGTEARCSTDTPVLFQVSVCTDMGVYQVVSLEAQMHQVPSRTHVPIATPKSGPRAPKRCACGGDAWAWR